MKRLVYNLVFAVSLALFSAIPHSFAQAETRNLNPGEDPNEAKIERGTEADVASTGVCRECIKNLVHVKLGENTNERNSFRAGSTGSGSEKGSKGDSMERGGTR